MNHVKIGKNEINNRHCENILKKRKILKISIIYLFYFADNECVIVLLLIVDEKCNLYIAIFPFFFYLCVAKNHK